MFTRIVKMTLKPNAGQEFTNALETTIIPVLRKQPGFRDEMLLVKPGAPEVVAISLWDSKESAERYERAVFPEVVKSLARLVEAAPRVETYALVYSSAHNIGLGAVPLQEPNTTPQAGVGG
jgi:heme-degrading monooxygenase HmoA